MYSLISDGSTALEKLTYSMWEASNLTSNQLGELRRKLTTTSARKETLLLEGWHDRAEIQISTLIISGLRRAAVRLVTSFCTFATSWLREISFEVFQISGLMPSGSGPREDWTTFNPQMLSLTRQRLMDSTSGSISLLWDLERLERGKPTLPPPRAGGRIGAKAPAPRVVVAGIELLRLI